jgi:hypothetical protein
MTEVSLLLSFRAAMHVEMTLEGGNVQAVQGSPVDDVGASFEFELPTRRSAAHDFSVGNYRVLFVAGEVDGEFRIDLGATPLAGSEL